MIAQLLPYAVTAFALWCAVNIARTAIDVVRELFAIRPARRRAEPPRWAATAPIATRPRAAAPLRQAA